MNLDMRNIRAYWDDLGGSELAQSHPEVAAVIAAQRINVLRAAEFLNEDGYNAAVTQFKAELLSALAFADPVEHFDNMILESSEGLEDKEICANLYMQTLFQRKFAAMFIGIVKKADTSSDLGLDQLAQTISTPSLADITRYLSRTPLMDRIKRMKKPTVVYVPNLRFGALIMAANSGFGVGANCSDEQTAKLNKLRTFGLKTWDIFIVDGRVNPEYGTEFPPSQELIDDGVLMNIKTFAMLSSVGRFSQSYYYTETLAVCDVDISGNLIYSTVYPLNDVDGHVIGAITPKPPVRIPFAIKLK